MGKYVLNGVFWQYCQEPYLEPTNIPTVSVFLQGLGQDLNRPLQDIAQNFDDDAIIMMLLSLSWQWGKNFKYCTILLNMAHIGRLCGVLGFTAPPMLISKKFQSKYIYTLNSALCAPNCTSSNKTVTFGCWIDMGVAYKPYKTAS